MAVGVERHRARGRRDHRAPLRLLGGGRGVPRAGPPGAGGSAARTLWDEALQEARSLVGEYWTAIEAIARRLTREDFEISGSYVPADCHPRLDPR